MKVKGLLGMGRSYSISKEVKSLIGGCEGEED